MRVVIVILSVVIVVILSIMPFEKKGDQFPTLLLTLSQDTLGLDIYGSLY